MSETITKTCPACGGAIEEGQAVSVCETCGKEYHADCFAKGGCVEETCKPKEIEATKAEEVSAPQESLLSTLKKKLTPRTLGIIGGVAVLVIILLVVLLKPTPIDDIVMDKSVEIIEGETLQLEYKVYPSKAKIKNPKWESSDEDVAKVDELGRIEAKKAGECEITLTVGDIEVEVEVTVKKDLPDFNKLFDEYCSSNWAEVGSDGSYLEVDTNPYNSDDYNNSQADSAIEKINTALGLSDSVYKDMCSTTWSMGKQSESFEDIGIKVEWTYHPDKGLEVTYKYIHN